MHKPLLEHIVKMLATWQLQMKCCELEIVLFYNFFLPTNRECVVSLRMTNKNSTTSHILVYIQGHNKTTNKVHVQKRMYGQLFGLKVQHFFRILPTYHNMLNYICHVSPSHFFYNFDTSN